MGFRGNVPVSVTIEGAGRRVLWVPPAHIDGTGSLIHDVYATWGGARLDNAQLNTVYWHFRLPADWREIVALKAMILNTTWVPGDVYWRPRWAVTTDANNEHLWQYSAPYAARTVAGEEVAAFDLAPSLAGLNADAITPEGTRIFSLALDRDATNAADTIAVSGGNKLLALALAVEFT